MTATLTAEHTASELSDTPFVHMDGKLHATYRTEDFAAAADLVSEVAEVADAHDHHPDIRLGFGSVSFELTSHDAGGVTDRDVALAHAIHELASSLGATGERRQPARYDVAIDCTDADAIREFWRVAMNYQEQVNGGETELVDPNGFGPKIWFQHMELPRTERNRIHLDVYVPAADAEQRVADIVAAGGLLLTDQFAPDWWVLADAEGNELCVCTSAA